MKPFYDTLGYRAIERLRTQGSRYRLREIQEMLDYDVSLATLSIVGRGARPCSYKLEKALIKLHNKKHPDKKIEVEK